MPYTLGQAAKAIGRTKATLQEAIKKGRISAQKDVHGYWCIDPAELHRVYPPTGGTASQPDDAEPLPYPFPLEEVARLQERVAGLERLCRQVEDERDSLREQNTRLTALLPKPGQDKSAKPSLWRRLGIIP